MEELPGPRQASCNWGKDTERWKWVWLSVWTVLTAYINTQISLRSASVLLFNTECQFSMPTCFSSVTDLGHFFLLLTLSYFLLPKQTELICRVSVALRGNCSILCECVTCLFSLPSAKIPFPNPCVPTVYNLPNTNLTLNHHHLLLLPPPPSFWGRVSLCISVLELTL